MKIGFVGLGVMGGPMAGHLVKAGHEICGYNRNYDKARKWSELYQAEATDDLVKLVSDCQALILCVGRDEDVRDVVHQTLESLRPGMMIIDHTTTSAHLAREMRDLMNDKAAHFVDAPVSGGQAGAENGTLALMVGCDIALFEAVTSITQPYTKAITHMGPVGTGQMTKMVNQICIAGVVQGLAEALHFTECAGLDPEKVLSAISQGAAGSWQMTNRWPTMTQGRFDFGFAVDWMRKDLGITLDEAAQNGARLELTRLVDGYYAEIQAMGGGRWDTSSLKARLVT